METKEIIKKLKEYQILCNNAIFSAQTVHIEGAVNWHDLKCNEVKFVINDDGDSYYEFVIDEVSPDNHRFQKYISDYLSEVAGINEDFYIITEW